MFPLNPGDELVFGNPTNEEYTMYGADHPDQQLFIQDHDQFAFSKNIDFASTSNNNTGKKKQKEAESGAKEREQAELRKAMHREIERKRRQEMSQLYDSLRSLLPQEQLRGKRSISDLMNEAVIYTKELEKNVKELRIRRDELKGQSSSSSHTQISNRNVASNNVTVNPDTNGIEILINSGLDFEISHVMIELLARELDVVSYVSTRSDDRMLHKLLAQANDTEVQIDISVLQGRLNEVANSLG